MVSASDVRKRFTDGAMLVEARKNPNSAATIAGPILMLLPRINTTRMIARISTADAEITTADHFLFR